MKLAERIKRLRSKIVFWVERESSVTLLFWLALLLFLLIRNWFKIK
jgi:hypothetical protein